VVGPILGIAFLRKFKVTVALETSQILFAFTAVTPSAPKPPICQGNQSIKDTAPVLPAFGPK
jgi:hypothetical protein